MAEAKKKAAAKKSPAKEAAAKKTASKKSAVKKAPAKKAAAKKGVSGYGGGSVEVVMSVDQVAKEAASIAANAPKISELDALADGGAFLSINNLRAGYGKMEILHDFSLRIGQGQSLCLIGPNGAGKSTVLHSIFGFTNIFSGSIVIEGQDVTKLTPSQKLAKALELVEPVSRSPARAGMDSPAGFGWSRRRDLHDADHFSSGRPLCNPGRARPCSGSTDWHGGAIAERRAAGSGLELFLARASCSFARPPRRPGAAALIQLPRLPQWPNLDWHRCRFVFPCH